jgi:hypothetical protein
MAERSPPILGDAHSRNLHRLAARDYALGRRGREPALMISTILIENPCAMSMDPVQPSHSFGSRSRLRTTST